MASVKNIEFSAGFITVTFDSGPPVVHNIADVLRAADIPVLTISSLELLTTLANVMVTVLKTLVENGVVGEEDFPEGFDLNYFENILTNTLSATWD